MTATYNGRKIMVEYVPKPLAHLPQPVSKADATYYNRFPYMSSNVEDGELQNLQDFANYVHIHRAIQNRAFRFINPIHREMMAAWHPWYNALIDKVSKALTKDEIRIVKPETKNDEEPELNDKLMDFWRERKFQNMLTLAIRNMKLHGPINYYAFKVKDYWTRPGWNIYSEPQSRPKAWDEFGHPIEWKIQPSAKNMETFDISLKGAVPVGKTEVNALLENTLSEKHCVWFDPHHTEDFRGKREGNNMWDALIDYLFTIDNWRSYLQKIGNGFMVLALGEDTTPDEEDVIDNVLNDINTNKVLKLTQSKESPVTVDWMDTGGGNSGFIECIDKMEDNFAVAMGYPKMWLLGDQEGAMESSGKNALQINIKMIEDFNFYVPNFVKAVLMFHDKISSNDEVAILPGFKTAMSEQEIAELDEIKTSTIAMKTWATPNEQRELDGMDPIDEEGADELVQQQEMNIEKDGMEAKNNDANIKTDVKFSKCSICGKKGEIVEHSRQVTSSRKPKLIMTKIPKGFEGAGNRVPLCENCRHSPRKQDSLSPEETLISILGKSSAEGGMSIRKMGEFLGFSPGVASNVRARMDSYKKPQYKVDDLNIKCDSVQISENMYRIEDAKLVLPQRKQYPRLYGEKWVNRPRSEIEKIFNDTTNLRSYGIGVNPDDSHKSRVPLEVLKKTRVAKTKFTRIDEDGNIRGDIEIDLEKVRKVLGENSWLEQDLKESNHVGTSVALYSVDKPNGNQMDESDLDVRSFVFTRQARNEDAGGS